MRTFPVILSALAAAMILAAGCQQAGQSAEVKTPLMGWSSWNAYMVNISDEIICHEADLLVEKGLRDKGYAQVNIDDGFFGPRTEDGTMTCNPTRFPQGMKPVADYIHSLGMKAGIYSDAGDNTCGSGYNKDTLGFGAGLYQHDIQDADLYFNQWGFDFIKIDYCGGRHAGLDEQTRYMEIRRVIDSVSTRPISINICRWAYPGTWVSQAGDSWRTTGDVRPNWASVKHIVELNLYMSAFARDGHYNDMDMLAVGYEGNKSGLGGENAFVQTEDYLTPDEEDAHFGLWCIMDSPLLLGCKLQDMPERTLELVGNEELIALNQDPLCLQAHIVQHIGDTYVFVKDLLEREGPKRGVALYNPADLPTKVAVTSEELGYTGELKVRDLLAHQDCETTDCICFEVPAHGVKMLSVEGQRAEQTFYEAEWAYAPKFTAIAEGPVYMPREFASGRAVVAGLGGEDNSLIWDDVWSDNGGIYAIEIATLSTDGITEPFNLTLTVNGILSYADKDGRFVVDLDKGLNKVVLSCEKPMPAIDCIRLTRM